MLPQASQARKAIWNAVDEYTGVRLIDQAFPASIRAKTLEDEMFISFRCGSTWQVVGSDNFDSLLGSPPVGLVGSEWAYSNPMAWQKLSPILANNGGWFAAISTPFGRNHFHGMHEYAKSPRGITEGWFTEVQNVEDTGAFVYARLLTAKVTGKPFIYAGRRIGKFSDMSPDEVLAFTREVINSELAQLASQRGLQEAQSIVQQEYYCSFDAAVPGAYYGPIIEGMERMTPSRITQVPYDPGFGVETWWDLGIRDDTAIWFAQKAGREYRIIDYYEAAGPGLDHYANVLREKNYNYLPTACVLPHDASHGQLSQRGGASLADVLAKQYGYRSRIVPQTRSLEYSINQVKSFLPTCVFDAEHCKDGLEKLRMYRRKWNEATRAFALAPLHDYTSHAADAFRTGVEGANPVAEYVQPGVDYALRPRHQRRFALTDDDPLHRG